MRRFVLWLWLLSGVPVGIALVVLPASARLLLFTLFVALETGHSLSPIALAWTQRGFRRQLILRQPWKYIALPTAIFGATAAVGVVTSLGWTSLVYGGHNEWRLTDWTNPFPAVLWIYWAWNIYHFAMQHFGALRLVAPGSWRLGDMAICLGLTVFCMAILPMLTRDPQVGLFMLGAISVNHWVVDIGMSSRVSQLGPLFAGGVLLAGLIGFLWEMPTSHGIMIRVIPVIVCARLGLGFVHFLYSRWVWRLSDPRVRATIGKRAFA